MRRVNCASARKQRCAIAHTQQLGKQERAHLVVQPQNLYISVRRVCFKMYKVYLHARMSRHVDRNCIYRPALLRYTPNAAYYNLVHLYICISYVTADRYVAGIKREA